MRSERRTMTLSCLVGCAAAAAWVMGAGAARSQDAETLRIATDGARPLADAVLELQTKYLVVITYEDPPYHASQVRDATDEYFHPTKPTVRDIVPRGGRFVFEYSWRPGGRESQWTAMLAAMLRQYRATGYGGDFRLDTTGAMFHVIPTTRRADGGVDEAYEAILSTVLDFGPSPDAQSARSALQTLVGNLTRVTGTRVLVGTVPEGLLRQTAVPTIGGRRSARSELIRILKCADERLSWRLLYDPADREFCLNIRGIW